MKLCQSKNMLYKCREESVLMSPENSKDVLENSIPINTKKQVGWETEDVHHKQQTLPLKL